MFIKRSMLVRLNLVQPLFCISLVSGPGTATESNLFLTHTDASIHTQTHTNVHMQTCKDHQAVAGLCIAEHTSSKKHVLVGQGVFPLSPVQSATEAIQLVVGRLTHYFTFTQGEVVVT